MKYVVGLYPIINGVGLDYSPILFEPGDTYDVRYDITRYGQVDFNEYMTFLHEAYKSDSLNIHNTYAGTWTFMF